jgi:hypothetical protein
MMRSQTEAARDGLEETFDNEVLKHLLWEMIASDHIQTNVGQNSRALRTSKRLFTWSDTPFALASEQKEEPQALPKTTPTKIHR